MGSDGHVCTLNAMGFVRCFGDNGRLGDVPEGPFTEISSGYEFACGLRDDGSLACWGQEDFGVLDAPDTLFTTNRIGEYSHLWTDASGQLNSMFGTRHRWTTRPASWRFFPSLRWADTLAATLSGDGQLRCWGPNQHGQATPPQVNSPMSLWALHMPAPSNKTGS